MYRYLYFELYVLSIMVDLILALLASADFNPEGNPTGCFPEDVIHSKDSVKSAVVHDSQIVWNPAGFVEPRPGSEQLGPWGHQ